MRFPEFKDEWIEVSLDKIVSRVTRKNKDNETDIPLTISAQNGLVDQRDFFNKVVASDNLTNYFLLKNGEFAYNKSYSAGYPWGAIKRLDKYEQGALSSLYICFAANQNVNSDYLVQYFETSKWYKVVSDIAGEGARNHGLLNVSVTEFFKTKHIVASNCNEQQKIAKFLSLLDKRIELQKSAIEKLKSLMAGIRKYAQSLNSCKRTFLRDILTERKEKNSSLYPVYSVAVKEGLIDQIEHLGRSFAAKDTSNYHVVNEDDIVYTKSPTGEFPYGIVKKSFTNHSVAVSPLYGVYIAKNKDIATFLHYYFLSPTNTNNYLHCLIQKGAKNTINITNQHFLDNTIELPDTEDLHKIVNGILAIQNKIEVESNTLKSYLDQKSYLLSKMFI